MSYYKKNKKKVYEQQKKYRKTPEGQLALKKARDKQIDKYRQPVLKHYGKVCKCCGEKTEKLLTLDHVNNDGKEHRERFRGVTYKIFKDVIDKKFPKDYQILCMNCNWGRSCFGICPHKHKKC